MQSFSESPVKAACVIYVRIILRITGAMNEGSFSKFSISQTRPLWLIRISVVSRVNIQNLIILIRHTFIIRTQDERYTGQNKMREDHSTLGIYTWNSFLVEEHSVANGAIKFTLHVDIYVWSRIELCPVNWIWPRARVIFAHEIRVRRVLHPYISVEMK